MKRSILTIAGALLMGGAMGGSAPAQIGPQLSVENKAAVQRCVSYILMGPQTNGITIASQGFNCKPLGAIKILAGGVYEVSGQLSHQLTARPDDQVNYTIQYTPSGELRDVRVAYDRGGFSSIPRRVYEGAGVGKFLPDVLKDVTGAIIDRLFVGLGGNIRNWQRSAELTISTVAVEIARSQVNRDTLRSVNYFVDNPGSTLQSIDFTPAYVDQHFNDHRNLGAVSSGDLAARVALCSISCQGDRRCTSWTLRRAVPGHAVPVCTIKGALGKAEASSTTLDRDVVSGRWR